MTHVLRGGRAFYGYDIGVLMLNNTPPRPLGDIGNAHSWGFPVLYEVVEPALPELVVEENARGLVDDFIAAAQRVERLGVRAIMTSCGFLAVYQRELAAAVDVPVATSSIMQVPLALRTIRPNQRICVMTINGTTLTPAHYEGAGVSSADLERVTQIGLEHTASLYPALIKDSRVLDVDLSRRDMVRAAEQAIADDPSIAGFVFECTNMPPYGEAVRLATGLPVWDVMTLGRWLHLAIATPVAISGGIA